MERLFAAVVGSAPGQRCAAAAPLPALMLLRSKHKGDAALVDAVLSRLDMDDESSSVQTMAFLVALASEGRVPEGKADAMLEKVVEFANAHSQWGDTLRWICAMLHFYCADVLTVAELADLDAIDVGAAAIVACQGTGREDGAFAACRMMEHFTCCAFKPQALHALRGALQSFSGNAELCRAAIATIVNATTFWGGTSDPSPSVDSFVAADGSGVAAVLAIMQTTLSNEAGTTLCLRALANCSAHNREANRAPVVAAVLAAKAQFPDSDDVTSQVLAFFANGASAPDVQQPDTLEHVLSMMNPAMIRAVHGERRVLTDVVHTLGSFATHWKDSKARMAKAGVVPALLQIMQLYDEDPVLQQQCCNLLSYLCFDSEAITSTVTQAGGVALVLRAMGKFRTNEQLLTAACAAVSGLTFNNPAGQAVVKQIDAVPLLLEILRTAKRPRLVEMACLALGTLCWNSELKSAIAEAHGIDLVVQALEKHASASGVVKNACRALAQIAFNSEKYRDEMTQRGAIRLIVSGMACHPQHDRAQLHACAALSYLSWTSPTNAADIVQHDGYRAIIRAMSHNVSNHEVQEHACRALANIPSAPAADTDAALQAIIDAMHRHDRIPEVQEEACRAIVTLALAAPENKSKLHEKNVSQAVVFALRRFPLVQLVQQEAANAIAHLAYEHPDLNRAITELDAVSLLVAAMRNFSSNSKLQLNVCGGLSALAFNNPTAQRQVSDLGGVPYILKAMRDFDRVRILELGCSLLGTLAWNSDIKEKVAEACVPTIIETMRKYPDSPCLQKATIRAAAQFAFDSEKNRVLLYEAQAVKLIVRALKEHMPNSKLIGHALVALTYLCWENGAIASAIMESDALQVVEEVMRTHGSCDRVASRANHLRRILQRRSTPTTGDAPPFPVGSPVLPYGRGPGGSSFSPPGSPTGSNAGGFGQRRGGRGGGGNNNHSPLNGSRNGGPATPLFPGTSPSSPSGGRGGRGYNASGSGGGGGGNGGGGGGAKRGGGGGGGKRGGGGGEGGGRGGGGGGNRK